MKQTILEMLDWFAANKDAVIAISALVSPVLAVVIGLISAFVSYRAVVTGPRIQREIAQEQFKLTSRQIGLQERSIAQTSAQISANLIGAADQKWIEALREAVAELAPLVEDRGITIQTQKQTGNASFDIDGVREAGKRIDLLISRIRLLVGPSSPDMPLIATLREWNTAQDIESRNIHENMVFEMVWKMMECRNERIAAHISGIASSPALPK